MNDFSGFPADAMSFLRELEDNNEKTWFDANKERYQAILETVPDFVEAMGARLQSISPAIEFDTRTNGAGSMMRIYRDVRFSQDKTPYKAHIAFGFWEGPLKKMQNPSFGFRFGGYDAELYAGLHMFLRDQLSGYRQAVDNETSGRTLQAAIAEVLQAGPYEIGGEHYKTTPRGYDAEHPRAELLKYSGLWATIALPDPAIVTTPELVDVCYEHCRNMAPIQRWLVENLGS
ncbi:MAG: DUF2461 domain-containing protein [Caldilineales bacterium]|nr:DUF2461 domain-containing protein [Caldilineales bacterium]